MPKTLFSRPKKDGGAEGIRTPDPHNAIVVLYQLSYDPIRDRQFRDPIQFVKIILTKTAMCFAHSASAASFNECFRGRLAAAESL